MTNSPEFVSLKEDISDIRTTLIKVADALDRLSRLEERHENTTQSIERVVKGIERVHTRFDLHETRLSALELSQPATKSVTDWAHKLAYGAIGILIMFVLKKEGVI